MLPTVQASVCGSYVPPAPLTNVTPAESWSRTITPEAASGPWLVTTRVYVALSPLWTVVGVTVLATDRSATPRELRTALAWSFSPGALLPGVEFGSNRLEAVTSAMLVIGPSAPTVAVICSVSTAPTAMPPSVQSPQVESYVPTLGVSET